MDWRIRLVMQGMAIRLAQRIEAVNREALERTAGLLAAVNREAVTRMNQAARQLARERGEVWH